MNTRIKKILPVLEWIPGYDRANLSWDAIAGITLAFFVIPESMAYASLAGLPPHSGIYCYLFAGVFYLIFGTSRQLAIGPTSSLSIVIGAAIGTMAGNDPIAAVAIASAVALIMAVLFFVAWLIKLSSLVSFISDTILVGFKAGAALVIISTQIPKLFGIRGSGSDFISRIWYLITHLAETNPVVLIFGLSALALLITGNYFFRGKPVSLVIVILSILLLSFTGMEKAGIHVVGEIPRGIPALTIPEPAVSEWNEIFFLAMACFFLSYVESISAGRTLARKNGYEVDPRQELLALGVSNLASSVGNGFAVAGGLSQSTVNDRSGAKTPLSLLFATIVLALSLLFLTGLFRNMPETILAVIVLDAVMGLIKVKEIRHLYRVDKMEFWICMLTIIAVIFFGVLKGIFIAVILSIIFLLKKGSAPHVAILGKIPGTDLYSDILRHPENEPVKGALILRPESSILYYNCYFLRDNIHKLVAEYGDSLKLVILDLSSANYVDISGARFIARMMEDLDKKNITFRLVDALGSVRDILRAEGIEKDMGHISRKSTINEILEEFHLNSNK